MFVNSADLPTLIFFANSFILSIGKSGDSVLNHSLYALKRSPRSRSKSLFEKNSLPLSGDLLNTALSTSCAISGCTLLILAPCLVLRKSSRNILEKPGCSRSINDSAKPRPGPVASRNSAGLSVFKYSAISAALSRYSGDNSCSGILPLSIALVKSCMNRNGVSPTFVA